MTKENKSPALQTKGTEPVQVSAKASSNKPTWLVWTLIGIIGLITVFGWQYYQFTQNSLRRREGIAIQQAKMTKFWQDQGLSPAEIEEKLKADRQQNFRVDGEPDFYRTIMRTVNHGLGGSPQGGGMGGSR